MKIGTIVQANQKGQIVIPKKIREAFGITPDVPLNVVQTADGISLYPMKEMYCQPVSDQSPYLDILKKTQGAWVDEDWDSVRKKRKKIELAASRKRKNAW